MPFPANLQKIFLGGLFVLSTLAALYVASSIILPVVLGFVSNLLLQPAVRLIERVHLPYAVGVLSTILLVIGADLAERSVACRKSLLRGIKRCPERHLAHACGHLAPD